MANNFQGQIGGVSIDFEAIPDLQPKAVRGIIKVQRLPEENVLRQAISTVPVGDKLFKARIDDAINLDMTPEVGMNSDDPMVGDTYRWKSDQVHDYRQAAKINREVGRQLLAPEGTPQRYAGQAELNRLMNRIVVAIDNRREYNRALSIRNAFDFDPSRKADLGVTNVLDIAAAADKWDYATIDAHGNLTCTPFNNIGACANKLGFISGKVPTSILVTPDILTALENHNAKNKTNELTAPTAAGARYTCRHLQMFCSQGRKDIGTTDAPKIVPMFQNVAIICSLDEETVAENQYDINRVEQFPTSDKLFYYVRYWHSSKVHVSRPTNFFFITNVLGTPYSFENISSLLD